MVRQSIQFRAKQITDEITIAPVAQMRFPPASLQVKKKQMAGRMFSKNFMYLGSPCSINLFYHYYLVMVHLLCERIQVQGYGELGKRPRKTKTAGIPAVKFAILERFFRKEHLIQRSLVSLSTKLQGVSTTKKHPQSR